MDPDTPQTSLGTATPDTITVAGKDLVTELMGEVDFGTMTFLVVAGRLPGDGEARLFNAVLVSLADHGLTPSVLAARLTHTGAPESLQGALAAGLLGAGSAFLGVLEESARMLAGALAGLPDDPDDDTLARAATDVVADHRDRQLRIPGLGHPVHTDRDPRTARLAEVAREAGHYGPHQRLLAHVGQAAERATGRRLPVNGAGAAGAALADLGFDPDIVRGFAVVARAAGLLGHLWEERRRPVGRHLWDLAEREVTYVPPGG